MLLKLLRKCWPPGFDPGLCLIVIKPQYSPGGLPRWGHQGTRARHERWGAAINEPSPERAGRQYLGLGMAKIASMTGFAALSGGGATGWAWELRCVNARGLEVRFRLPAGLERLEGELRNEIAARLRRGTLAVTLRLSAPEAAGVVVDRTLLAQLVAEAESWAAERPGTPRPRIESLMALPGVLRRNAGDAEFVPSEAALAEIRGGFDAALLMLVGSREAEGARLADVLAEQLRQLEILHGEAVPKAALQIDEQRARLAETVRGLLSEWQGAARDAPADRLAQELALLASRSDVAEEIDRLASHITAARDLLAAGGPQGRQLDFLVQEFMREANTLCSKSASIGLTGTGLRMKGVIEQIREQVQNIE